MVLLIITPLQLLSKHVCLLCTFANTLISVVTHLLSSQQTTTLIIGIEFVISACSMLV